LSPRRPTGIAAAIAAHAAADAAAAISSDVDSDEEAMGILNALRRSRSNPRLAPTTLPLVGSSAAQGSAKVTAEGPATASGGGDGGGGGGGVYASSAGHSKQSYSEKNYSEQSYNEFSNGQLHRNKSAGSVVTGRRSLDNPRFLGGFQNQPRARDAENIIPPESPASDYFVPCAARAPLQVA
ncbi:hypothetical protein CLOM_g1771, partial [Closterium sp. NIES-68]